MLYTLTLRLIGIRIHCMSDSKRVITFGEVLLRFNPTGYERLLQATDWKASYSGAEANVAVSLANFGLDVFLVTKVPSHDIGQCAVNWMRHYGVHMSKIARGGERLGVYYIEIMICNVLCMLLNGIGDINVQMFTWIMVAVSVLPFTYYFACMSKMGVEGIVVGMVFSLLWLDVVLPIKIWILFRRFYR
mgnify:CR=1 FL=1